MTSTDVAVIDGSELAALAAAVGASTNDTRIPTLKANMSELDDQGRELKKGTFVIQDKDGENVYGKTATIRPLSNLYRYIQYDDAAKKMVGRTILAKSFREEFIDTKGTVRCGKPPGAIFKNLPDDKKKLYDDITTERVVYAIATMSGVTADGQEREIGPIGVQMSLKGANFMPFEEQVVKKIPKGRNIFDYELKLTTKSEINGTLRYFIIQFGIDLSNPLPMDQDTLRSLRGIAELIEQENASVRAKYDAALRGNQEDTDADEFHNDSMDDDIPF